MAFEFTCPFCLSRMQVAEEFLGMSGPCAECGRPVVMPTRDAERRLVMAVQTGKAPGRSPWANPQVVGTRPIELC